MKVLYDYRKDVTKMISEYIKIEKSNVGTNIIRINSEQIQWVITPDGEYQFMNGKLVKVPPPSL